MHVFNLHKRLIDDYASYITSFIHIRDQRIEEYVKKVLSKGIWFWMNCIPIGGGKGRMWPC